MELFKYIIVISMLAGFMFSCTQDKTANQQKNTNSPAATTASVLPDFSTSTDTIPMAEKILHEWKIVSYTLGGKELPMERYKGATIEFTAEGRIKNSLRNREERYRIEGDQLIYPNMPDKQATLEDIGSGQIAVLAKDKKGVLARMVLERTKK